MSNVKKYPKIVVITATIITLAIMAVFLLLIVAVIVAILRWIF